MKIGILTYHYSVNNGAVMQAYSLSKRLKEEYPEIEIEIIDYRMTKVIDSYSYRLKQYLKCSSLKVFLGKVKNLIQNPLYLWRLQKRTKTFEQCMYKLPLSERKIVDDIDEMIAYINENYDVMIVGSDAIWNYIFRGFPNLYLPDERIKCKKLSYAASCYGMDFLKRPSSERDKIKKVLSEFSFIGVRDNATENFVKWCACLQVPVHTCDPTVFLDVDRLPINTEKLREKLTEKGFDWCRPALGLMGDDDMLKMIRKMYGNTYQIVSLYKYVKGADVNLYNLEPYEWAYVFRYFELTFTTYFHGTLLSLRNGVPVICIALQTEFANNHVPKTLDVLQRLGFQDWYFETDYKSLHLREIKEKADELLSNNCYQMITEAMDTEALSFQHFSNELQKIIEEKRKTND